MYGVNGCIIGEPTSPLSFVSLFLSKLPPYRKHITPLMFLSSQECHFLFFFKEKKTERIRKENLFNWIKEIGREKKLEAS